MNNCLSQELTDCYVSGRCSHEQLQTIESHLAECGSCRRQIRSLKRSREVTKHLDVTATTDVSVGGELSDKTQVWADERPAYTALSQSGAPTAGGEAGSIIEGYRILAPLPAGGQAIVYKATQEATKRVVALKVLLEGPKASTRAQYRFEREVDLAASLQHPNIVTIFDSGIGRGQYYFAMQYIEGKPLDEYVRSNELSLRQILTLFDKICSAVAYAHQRGVMHRDLKPGNILVDADGEPHILDFGLAKLVDGSEQTSPEMVMTSIPGKVIGTLAFMSPEQASAQPDHIDVRTDVYSIGVILYRVLTGSLPYDMSGSMLAILRNIQETEPTRPSKIVRGFNSEVEAILLKALAKEPAYRYQSAAHLHQDISGWLAGKPIAAKADNSLYLLRKIITRHYYTSAVVAMLLVIVFGFSCFYYQLYGRLRKTNTDLESTVASLHEETARYSNLAARIGFVDFLDQLQAGRLAQSEFIARHFVQDTREMKAARFLLDGAPLNDKVAQLRQSLGQSEPLFTEFVIGEHHLKDGDRAAAVDAYRRCLSYDGSSTKDRWLVPQIKSRLYELTEQDRPTETTATVEDEEA